jgi:hypothetical protein
MPEIKVPKIIKKNVESYTSQAEHVSDKNISQLKERVVKKGAKIYNYDGAKFTAKGLVEKESIKVFLLEQSANKDGLVFERVRIGDPAIGEDFYIYSGDLLDAVSINNVPTVKSPRELVGNFPIYLSGNSFNRSMGKNGERQGTGEIFIPHLCEAGYQYFFTLSGDFEKVFWHLPFVKISWQGNDAVAGQGINKPFPNLQYGALTLRIGNKEGLIPMAGKNELSAMIISPTAIFSEININREIDEYYDPTTKGLDAGNKLQKSNLSIKIERRRLIE